MSEVTIMRNFKLYVLIIALVLGVGIAYKANSTITDPDVLTTSALGNGATTNYSIGFDFQDNDEIRVILQDESTTPYTQTEIAYGSGAGKYTITGGDPGTTVVMGTAPTSNERVIMRRYTPVTQQVSYSETEAFPATDHEEQMDRMVQMIQEVGYSTIKAIKLSNTSTATTPTFPDPVANTFIVYDENSALGTSTVGDISAAVVAQSGALVAANDLSDVNSVSTSRTNLGLSTGAVHDFSEATWNANKLNGIDVVTSSTTDGYLLAYSSSSGDIELSAPASSGLPTLGGASTVLNVNQAGSGLQYTQLENAHISSSAQMARTKLATGTAYRVMANDSSGDVSENAALTAGGACFADANGQLATDATNFYFDDTNNRLGVGVDATENTVTIGGVSYGNTVAVHAEGSTDLAELGVHRHSDTAGFGSHIVMNRSRGSEASETVVQSGDVLARIDGVGHDGTDYALSSQIDMEVDGTPGAGDMPGRIKFLVSPDGGETPAEAVRISSDKTLQLSGTLDTALTTAGPTYVDSSGIMSSEAKLDISRGGTGQSTAQAAIDALLPSQSGNSGEYLTTDGTNASWATVASGSSDNANDLANVGLSTSVGSSALTIAIKQADGSTDCSSGASACVFSFGGTGAVDGSYQSVSLTSSSSLTIPSTATMGHVSATQHYIFVYAINNAGTVEPAVSTVVQDEAILHSTTALSTGSDSAGILYSTSARTNVRIRLIGRLSSTQTTAGTWNANVTAISNAQFATVAKRPFWTASVSTATPTIVSQDGNWITSGVNNAAGDVTLTLTSGYFAKAPRVFFTAIDDITAGATFCEVATNTAQSTTTLRFKCFNDGGVGRDVTLYIMAVEGY